MAQAIHLLGSCHPNETDNLVGDFIYGKSNLRGNVPMCLVEKAEIYRGRKQSGYATPLAR